MNKDTLPNQSENINTELTEAVADRDWLYDVVANAVGHLEELRLWMKIWTRHSPRDIPGIDGYTASYPEWPFTVQTIYYWPLDLKRGARISQNPGLIAFLDEGAAQGLLVFRRYPEGYDWAPMDQDGYKRLCAEFGYAESQFGVKNNTRKSITFKGKELPSRIAED